jgi:hypothetical protein
MVRAILLASVRIQPFQLLEEVPDHDQVSGMRMVGSPKPAGSPPLDPGLTDE